MYISKFSSSTAKAALAQLDARAARSITEANEKRHVDSEKVKAAREFAVHVAGMAYSVDERGGIFLVQPVDGDALRPLGVSLDSSIELDKESLASGGGREARRRRMALAAASTIETGSSASQSPLRRAPAPSSRSVPSRSSNGGSSVGGGSMAAAKNATSVSARRIAASSDPKFFRPTMALPQGSIFLDDDSLGSQGEGGGGSPRSFNNDESSLQPRASFVCPAVSPGVRVVEGEKSFIGSARVEDPLRPSKVSIVNASKTDHGLGPNPPSRTFWHPMALPTPLAPTPANALSGIDTRAAKPTLDLRLLSSSAGADSDFLLSEPSSPRAVTPRTTPSSQDLSGMVQGGAYAVAIRLRKTGKLGASSLGDESPVPEFTPGAKGSSRNLVKSPITLMETGQPIDRATLLNLQAAEAKLIKKISTNPFTGGR